MRALSTAFFAATRAISSADPPRLLACNCRATDWDHVESKTVAGRIIALAWQVACMLLLASYTANLANELIVESSGTTVMRTLADNAQKQLGCQSGVAVCTSLQLTEPREHV